MKKCPIMYFPTRTGKEIVERIKSGIPSLFKFIASSNFPFAILKKDLVIPHPIHSKLNCDLKTQVGE